MPDTPLVHYLYRIFISLSRVFLFFFKIIHLVQTSNALLFSNSEKLSSETYASRTALA
jgi:hypothetical protein